MARTPLGTPPKLRRKGNSAVVTIDRRDIYLGIYGSSASIAAYTRIVVDWNEQRQNQPSITSPSSSDANPSTPSKPSRLTVAEAALCLVKALPTLYKPESHEPAEFRRRVVPTLVRVCGELPAREFGPKKLREVRQAMIDHGWCRTTINRQVTRVKTIWRWLESEELVPGGSTHALCTVRGLDQDTPGVKEAPKRTSAFWDDLQQVLPFCTSPVAAMLQLQWLTGMRSGEVRRMRTVDIDRTNADCWMYRPGSDAGPFGKHKNAWRGQLRVIPLGPKCIEIVTPFLKDADPTAFLFSPQQAVDERNRRRRVERKTPRYPSHLAAQIRKAKPKPKRTAGTCYTVFSYPQSVKKACAKAGVKFVPYSLRHGAKMTFEKQYGSEGARVMLGQKSIDSTQHYGTLDLARAAEIAKRSG